jgi:hypothetical protein
MRSITTILVFLGALSSAADAFAPVLTRSSPQQRLQNNNNNNNLLSTIRLYSEEGGSSSERSEDAVPPPPPPPPPAESVPRSPPTPPQKRLDPMIASLTRVDPNAPAAPTKNIPLLGEVPIDGSLVVLVPAAVIAVAGFVLSLVIAVNSSDQIVNSLSQVADEISTQATEKVNRQYDENACRGLCSSQEQDLEGLKSFMEGLRKN